MATTALDTIEAVKRLTKEYEFSEKQAEGITVMLRDNVMSDLATKEDVRRIEKDVQGLKEDVQGLKEDVRRIEKDVQGLKEDVQGLKKDVQGLKKDVQRLEEKTALMIEAALARHGKDILDKMDSRFAEMEVRFREMDKRFHQTMVLMLLAIGVATAVISAVIAL